MARSQWYEAIVLKTHDVGEADRFCILFTRECGRLAARARAVRKLWSRMGAQVLPLHRVRVELTELSSGAFLVTGAVRCGSEWHVPTFKAFALAEQGIELLLALLHDGEPLPELFALTEEFLICCREADQRILLPYTIKLLHLLGHFPAEESEWLQELSDDEQRFVRECCRYSSSLRGIRLPTTSAKRLQCLCAALLADQLSSPLRASAVAATLEVHRSE